MENDGELPRPVAFWLGLTYEDDEELRPDTDPELTDPVIGTFTAIQWNDTQRAGFRKIAELIEDKYLAKVTK